MGTPLQAGSGDGQPQAQPARLPVRETLHQPGGPRRQQGRSACGRRLCEIDKAPREKKCCCLCRGQGKTPCPDAHARSARQQSPRSHRGRKRRDKLDPQHGGLERQAADERPARSGKQIQRRADHDERQPERCGPAVDLPGPQHQPRGGRGPLPQQCRPACAGQQRGQSSVCMQFFSQVSSHNSVSPLRQLRKL